MEVHGGTNPYQYAWSAGNYTSPSVSNLAPGAYTVIVTDKNGCMKNDTTIIAPSSAIQLQLSATNVLCAGESSGAAEAIVTGGTAPYYFQWTNASQIFNTNPITNVAAATYNLKLQDAVGCSVTESVIISEPEALKVHITTEHSYCNPWQ